MMTLIALTRLGVSLVLFVVLSSTVSATTITIVNRDGPNEGINSPVSVNPVPGNSATTLGRQYQNVFRAAADYWEGKISSSVEIRIDVQLDPLDCDSGGGVLGAAGPQTVHGNFRNVPVRDTLYVQALANSIHGSDLVLGTNDVNATFNSGLTGNPNCVAGFRWWLGIDAAAPNRTISLFDTILHEIGHGLGFLSLVDSAGRKFRDADDIFSTRLFDLNSNRFWPSLSNSQRAASARSRTGLVWNGANVDQGAGRFTSGQTNGRLRLFAPSVYREGSSVSHWDTSLSPDELMEPFATQISDSCATVLAFADIGWNTMEECILSPIVIAPILLLLLED